ncbi:MAG: GspMb/PilO family protein [Aquabacterium sp.]
MIVRLLKRLGIVGFMGLSLLAACAWGRFAWLPAQQHQIDDLGSQVRRARHELLAATSQAASGADASIKTVSSADQAWQVLWDGLPDADQRVPLQSMVLRAAKANGLQISTVQYQGNKAAWSAQGGKVLWRQRMEMPVEGSYPALRQWLTTLLKEPALAIDAVDIQRPDVMSDQVKGRVVLSLWWRKPERSAAP